MKLLIVEDEKSTREGLIASVDWNGLGITEVFSAPNGEKGLMEARRYRPEIVLTDIRMPRMDGIQMAEKIREFMPDCRIVFLSAYAEISYYREALKLKVDNYVEKPIAAEELTRVMKEAVAQSLQAQTVHSWRRQHRQQELAELAARMSLPNQMDAPGEIAEEYAAKSEERQFSNITAVIMKFACIRQEELTEYADNLYGILEEKLKAMQMRVIYMVKDGQYLVLYFFSRAQQISSVNWKDILASARDLADGRFPCYITKGETVDSIRKSYKSYQSAAVLIQQCFYEPYGTVLGMEAIKEGYFFHKYQEEKEQILKDIEAMREENVTAAEEKLYQSLMENKNAPGEYVREMYGNFCFAIFRQAEVIHLDMKDDMEKDTESKTSWSKKIERFNLSELHSYFGQCAVRLFAGKESMRYEQSTVSLIKSYMKANYQNALLSLKDIGSYAHISSSYMCSVFKNETGITINQYLTDIRMEKAKKYLKDTRYSVAEICEMVGYKDNSYFGRNFRKIFHLTPMEYREQWLRGGEAGEKERL